MHKRLHFTRAGLIKKTGSLRTATLTFTDPSLAGSEGTENTKAAGGELPPEDKRPSKAVCQPDEDQYFSPLHNIFLPSVRGASPAYA